MTGRRTSWSGCSSTRPSTPPAPARAEDLLLAHRLAVYQAGRGGQYTYYGPGQRVVYLMLDLKRRRPTSASTCAHWKSGSSTRSQGSASAAGDAGGGSGIWVERPSGGEAKIAAIGVRVRRWVTYHGIAINPDLEHFSGIVPCGLQGFGVTSFANFGLEASMADLDARLRLTFSDAGTEVPRLPDSWHSALTAR